MNSLIQDDKHIYSFLLVNGIIEWVIFFINVNPSHPRDPMMGEFGMGQDKTRRQAQTRPLGKTKVDIREVRVGKVFGEGMDFFMC